MEVATPSREQFALMIAVYAALLALFVWLSWRWIRSGPPEAEEIAP
jgi:cytochrome bd-type quinol oxidase subunit 1